MRKSWIGFGVVAGTAAAVAVAPYFIDWNWFKPYLVGAVEDATGYQVEVAGEVQFALLPTPRLSAERLTVMGFGASKAPLVTADKLSAAVAFLPLLSKKAEVRYIALQRPTVRLVSYADGTNNWQKPGEEEGGGEVSVDDFRIEDGTFVRTGPEAEEFRIDDINANLTLESAQGPYALDGSLRYGTMPLSVKASYKPGGGVAVDAEIEGAGTIAFNGRIGEAGEGEPMPVDGRLSVKSDKIGAMIAAFSGSEAEADQAPVYVRPLTLKAGVQGSTERIHLRDIAGKLGDSAFSGEITAALGERTDVEGRLAIDALNFADLSSPSDAPREEPFELPKDMTADVLLRIVNAAYGTAQLGAINAPVTLADGTLSLGKTRIDLPGGGKAFVAGRLNAVGGKPVFNGRFSAGLPRTAVTLAAFGNKSYSALPTVSLTGDILYRNDVVTAGNLKGSVDGKPVSGQIRYPLDESTPIDIALAAASVDMDRIVAREDAPENKEEAKPVRFNVRIGELLSGGSRYGGITAAGSYANDRVSLTQAVVKDALGFAVAAKGSIDDVSGDRNADLALTLASPDVKGAVTVKGPSSKMTVGGSVAYAGATVGLNGWVGIDPETAYQLAVTAKAPEAGVVLARLQDEPKAAKLGPLDIGMRVEGKGDAARLGALAGKIGSMSLKGDATVNTAGDVPVVNAELTAGVVPLSAFLGSGEAGAEQAAANGERWSREPLSFDWIRNFDGRIVLNATRLTYDDYVIENPAVAILSRGGALNIEALKGQIYGGQLAVTGMLRAGPKQSLTLDVALSDVPLEPLLKATAASAPATGTLDFTGKFSASGGSQRALMESLAGPVRIAATNGVIRKIDLKKLDSQLGNLRTVNSFLQFAATALKGGETQYRTLAADLSGQAGRFTIAKLVTDLDGGRATAKGYVDIGDWKADVDAVLTLGSHEDAPAIPVSIKGALPRPAVAYNLDPLKMWFGKRVALAGINAAVKGEGLDLGGILGTKQQPAPGINPGEPTTSGAAPGNQAAEAETKAPEKSVDEELGGAIVEGLGKLFGKKKQEPAEKPTEQPN